MQVNMNKMTISEFQKRLEKGIDVAFVPMGATEVQGHHLPISPGILGLSKPICFSVIFIASPSKAYYLWIKGLRT